MPGWPDGYPSRGAWQFHSVTGSFDYWPLLDTLSITQLHPDGIMPMEVQVEDRDSTFSFEDGDEHWAKFEGVKIWAGHIRVTGKSMMSEAGPRVWSLTGQDFTAKLDDSVILTDSERPVESISERVTWILSHLNFAITTANVNLPAGNVEPAVYEGMTVREALQQVSDEKGLHFYVDFDKDLHLFRTETIAAPFDMSTNSPDYSTSFPYDSFDYQTDDIELTNAVRVKGLRYKRWRTDSDSIAAYGRQESAIIDDSLITLAQVNAAGDRRLYQLAEPIVDGKLTCWEPGLRAGMTFALDDLAWGITGDFIVTSVDITAVDPHDEDGKAQLKTDVTFSDKRRIGRFPGGGKEIKDDNRPPGGGGGGSGGGATGDSPGTCCNPINPGENPLIEWTAAGTLMRTTQGFTSGTSHNINVPEGSGYLGGVVAGEIQNRYLFLFMMTGDELPGSGGGVDVSVSPWDLLATQVIACTHGFAPFNAGHPNMQTYMFGLDVDANPGLFSPDGDVQLWTSTSATEILWAAVLVGGATAAPTVGPNTTSWDMADWSSPPDVATGNRNLYLSVAFNRYWNNSEHGLGLSAEDHNTSIVTGLPDGFTRLVGASGSDLTLDVDHAFSPVDTGSGLPSLPLTGYLGTGGSQDFIITRLFAIELSGAEETSIGVILPGPTWEGGNTFELVASDGAMSLEVVGDNLVATSSVFDSYATYRASGDTPELPVSLDDWAITQPFILTTAGSLTDDGSRFLQIQLFRDNKVIYFMLYLGDSANAQGVSVYTPPTETFVAKDIEEGVLSYFKFGISGDTAMVKLWTDGDPEPDWDVQTTDFQEASNATDFISWSISLGNDGGTAQVLTLYPPTIEGLVLPGEQVDWEIVGYGDNTTVTFSTYYPYDELSLHIRIDGQVLSGTAIESMDGAAGTFTLVDPPYGDPSDPTGSSVIEAKYQRV